MKPPRSPELPDPSNQPEFPWDPWFGTQKTEDGKEKPGENDNKNKKPETKKETDEPDKPEKKEEKQKEAAEKAHHKKEKDEKERRKEQLERSVAYKKRFEETPVPKDPSLVARLLIADRIVSLNEVLENSRTGREKEADTAALTSTLSYLGELSDKFENPEAESSPEIQQAYEAILQFTTEALEEVHTPDELIAVNELSITEKPLAAKEPMLPTEIGPEPSMASEVTNTPVAKTPQASTAPVTATLLKALTGPIAMTSASALTPSGGTSGGAASTLQAAPTTVRSSPADSYSLASSPLRTPAMTSPSAERARAEYRSALRRERVEHTTAAPAALPAALAAVALLSRHTPDKTPTDSFQTEAAGDVAPQNKPVDRETAIRSPMPLQSREHHTPASTPLRQNGPETPQTSPPAKLSPTMKSEVHTAVPTQPNPPAKFEFMSLHSLLTAAEHVPVGHGNYLRRAYEKGQIDKDGLISVLKANAKGKDFHFEFQKQARRVHQLRASSPEFLGRPSDTASQPSDETGPAELAAQKASPAGDTLPTPHTSSETVKHTLDSLKTTRETTWPAASRPMSRLWIIAGILLAGALAAILVFILI